MANRIIYIMGVSGSGKTTIGVLLSKKIGIPFFDADDFHSVGNKEKMKAGLPLTDDDRKDWLLALHQLATEQMQLKGAIIACSALKEKYRLVLTQEIENPFWVFLQGNYKTILQRLQQRKNHYMPPSLLQSQFDSLEIPAHAFVVNIEKAPEIIVQLICEALSAI